MGTLLLLFLLVIFGGGFGIAYLIIKIISCPSDNKGKKKLQELRSTTPDISKILGEMRFIAEVNFKLYDKYNRNKKAKSTTEVLGNLPEQNKLPIAMNHNVKAEWEPRFKFLKEKQDSFYDDSVLYNAFIECKEIDKGMRKMTLLNINLINFYEYYIKMAKTALKGTAIMTIASIVVVGVMGYTVNKAGRDIGTGP